MTVTCPEVAGVQASIATEGLKYVSHKNDGVQMGTEQTLIVLGTTTTYTYEVTAKEGESFSLNFPM